MVSIILLLMLLTRFALYRVASADGNWELYDNDGYKALRDCAKSCLGTGGCGAIGCNNPIPKMLSCEGNMVNSCVCRPDLQSIAESAISSCAKMSCANTLDISSTTSVYL